MGSTRAAPSRQKRARSGKRVPLGFSARSWRLFRLRRTTELESHVGGEPNVVMRSRIERYVRLEWELKRDLAVGAVSRVQRLSMEKLLARLEREIGLQPPPPPPVDPLAAMRASLEAFAASRDDPA